MLRSMLFVPGDQPRKIQKALAEVPTDAAILDLEDAVAIAAKPETREPVAAALRHTRQTRLYVRVNGVATPWLFGDLEAVVQSGLDGLLVPKVGGWEEVFLVDRFVAHLEGERGLVSGAIDLIPLIESAAGAAGLADLTRACQQRIPRVRRLGLGAADFTADVGATWTPDEQELLFVRSALVLHSRAAGLEPPLDTVYPHFRDAAGFEATTRRSHALGFQGRMCVHPNQIEAANRLYSPTPEQIAWAEEVLLAFAEAEARGVAALEVHGQLVDYAFVVRARQIVRQAGKEEPAP